MGQFPVSPNKDPKKSLILFLGNYRPLVPKDQAKDIITNIQKSPYVLKKVYVYTDDPLLNEQIDGVKVVSLPRFMANPAKKIKEEISNPKNAQAWQKLLEEIKSFDLDLGLVVYTYWMPPELFEIPKQGFVNFHPGPLPMIRGFEPETAGILLGLQNFSGTYHKISAEFDLGDLYEASPEVTIEANTTAYGLYVKVTQIMADTVHRFLNRMSSDKIKPIPQKASEGFMTNMTYIKDQANIYFNYDTSNLLDRKNRAINGQDFPYPLGYFENEEDRVIVYNLVTQKGLGELEAGQKIGTLNAQELGIHEEWDQAPIFSLADGLCALQIKPEKSKTELGPWVHVHPTKPRAFLTEFNATADEEIIAKHLNFLLITMEQSLGI
jgi:methionyl-tRNA formyltransferase